MPLHVRTDTTLCAGCVGADAVICPPETDMAADHNPVLARFEEPP